MEGTLKYLKGLEPQLGAAAGDDFGLMIQNVFQEIDGYEFRLACHHDGSVLLEKLLQHATLFQVRVFWDRLAGCFVRMACHRYASHVLEALLKRSKELEGAAGEDEGEDTGVLLGLPALLQRFQSELWQESDVVLKDTYASHVLRAVIEHSALSADFAGELAGNLVGCATSQTIAPVLQSFVRKNSPQSLLDLLSADRQQWRRLAFDRVGSRTCEAVVEALPKPDYLSFYQRCLRGQLSSMVADAFANFVVQALIHGCPSEELFRLVLSELNEDVLALRPRLGVVFKIVDWPVRHGRAFEPAMETLYACFGCRAPGEKQGIVKTLCDSKIGLSVLAVLPKYPADHNKHIVSGLLDMADEQLVAMAKDRTAAHVLEAMLSATSTTSSKARSRIIRRLLPHAADLAVDRTGSYVIECAFRVAGLELKEAVARQLSSSRARLEDSLSGRILLSKYRIEDFERRHEQWAQDTSASSSKRAFLADLLDDSERPFKK